MKISVVIPAHNEEGNVGQMITMLNKYFGRLLSEIIIVNDCSSDATGKVLAQMKHKYSRLVVVNRKGASGVGRAMRAGLKAVSGQATHVLMLDCDFTKNLDDINRVIKASGKVDGVLGSRYMRGGVLKNYPAGKKAGNRMFHFLCQLFLGLKHKDVTNNFRLYKREIIERIRPLLISTGFSINSEIGLYPILLGYKIKEVPVSWIQRTTGMGLSDFKVFKVSPGYIKIFLRVLQFKLFGFPAKFKAVVSTQTP